MPPALPFSTSDALYGARLAVPLAVSAALYGAVFGVLAQNQGLSMVEGVGLSATVFAGAAQFVILPLWTSPLPVFALLLALVLVNARFLLYGAALSPWFSRLSRAQAYGSLFFLADENWALAVQDLQRGGNRGALLLGSGLLMYVGWVGGTALGYAAGGVVEDPARWGLDFVYVAVFVALLVGMRTGRSDLLPWGLAAVVAVVAERALPGAWYIVLGGLTGSLAGGLRHGG